MAIIDELLVALGYDYDDDGVKQFSKDLNKTVGLVKKFAVAAVAAATAVTGLTAVTTAAADEQGKLANEVGISVGELDALQFAAKRSGASAGAMASGLRNLGIRASEASRGMGEGVLAFSMLGISVRDANGQLKGTGQLLREVSGGIQGMDRGRQLDILSKLGLQDSSRLLQQGPAEIANLVREAEAFGTTTAEDAAIAAEFQDSLANLYKIMNQLARLLVRVVGPILQNIAEYIEDWWKANRKIIEQNIPKYIEGLTLAFRALTLAAGVWIGMRIIQHGLALIKVFKTLTVLTALSAAGPLLLFAALALIAIAIEDIYASTQGKDSFFGDLMEGSEGFSSTVMAIVGGLKTFVGLIDQSIQGWKMLFKLISETPVPNFIKTFLNSGQGSESEVYSGDISNIVRGGGRGQRVRAEQSAADSATVVGTVNFYIDGSRNVEEVVNEVMNNFTRTSKAETFTMVDQ